MSNNSPSYRSGGVINVAEGTLTGAGSAETLVCGFIPSFVKVFNETDVIVWEKYRTQADANTFKLTAAAVGSKDTGSAIVINTDGTVTLSATLAASGKVLHWLAYA